MEPKREFDVDQAAQDVVNAWGTHMKAGTSEHLSADFKALFERMQAYRYAKKVGDNRREHDALTEEEATQEQITKKEFLDAYRVFYETRGTK